MRILLIEDEAALARPLMEHLEADHHIVEWFSTLDEAHSAVLALDYDVVLLDLQLPDGDGLTFLSTVRARGLRTPIIILIRDLTICLSDHSVSRAGQPVRLTAKEWGVLDALLRRKTQIVPKDTLEAAIYGYGEEVESNALEAHVSRLRTKLGKDLIATHRGIGYSLQT
mgnify:CR=1 FL=1